MIQFDAAPAVPLDYSRLAALSPREIEQGRIAGYIEISTSAAGAVRRAGIDNYREARAGDDMKDWRTRMYAIWFCYIYENFAVVEKPLYAIEELILEFKAQDVLDLAGRRLATLYAGAGGWEPISTDERDRQIKALEPHYERALALLQTWGARH